MQKRMSKHHMWMAIGRTGLGLSALGSYARIVGSDIHITDRTTNLVIEGYPRSANTLAVAAVRYCAGEEIRIAHHVHSHQQIIRAVQFGVPAVVLIREPSEAIASMSIRDDRIDLNRALMDYIQFYMPLRGIRSSLAVAEFHSVLLNFDRIIETAARLANTKLPECVAKPGENEHIMKLVDEMDKRDRRAPTSNVNTVARPSKARSDRLETARLKIVNGPTRFRYLAAKKVYEEFIGA